MRSTCISCQLLFENRKEQAAHYVSPLHRYNLARKTQDLAAVSKEEFDRKSLMAEGTQGCSEDSEAVRLQCVDCQRIFKSRKTLQTHLASRKTTCSGQSRQVKQEEKEEEIDRVLDKDECFFCNHREGSIEGRLEHMQAAHGFFVADREYLSDLPGLLGFLAKWIGEYKQCLHCGDRMFFESLQETRRHMKRTGHCNVRHEDKQVARILSAYYTFGAVDDEGYLVDSGAVQLGQGWLGLPSGRLLRSKTREWRGVCKTYEREKPRSMQTVSIGRLERKRNTRQLQTAGRQSLALAKKKNKMKHFRAQIL